MTVCVENAQIPLIFDSEACFSIVSREYLYKKFPNWAIQLLPTKAKCFDSESGKMKEIGTIIKEIIIPPRKGNSRLNQGSLALEDTQIQGFLLGTYYQRMYEIDIYNSKDRNITIGTNRETKPSLYIYHFCNQGPLEELLNAFKEAQFISTHTINQNLSLIKSLRKNRTTFSMGQEPLGKIRGHDIEIYLNVERPYPLMLRRPPYPKSLETRI
ncbi:hypothetical protein O181_003108 [Austropuccinia psidii MF-1]|uniref:Uncharacterized protein n=1 Tax=Austropuccinia psidii MF-1 TaxID=1389203 RepID=A0A9Q3BE09_9BASI|nr:hypothetical protein [Austropuccinia psidii MF-1]